MLLAHFHYCNKGLLPFSDGCKVSELQNLAQLNTDAVDFVLESRKLVNVHSMSCWPRQVDTTNFAHAIQWTNGFATGAFPPMTASTPT